MFGFGRTEKIEWREILRILAKKHPGPYNKPGRFIVFPVHKEECRNNPNFELMIADICDDLGYVYRYPAISNEKPCHVFERKKLWRRDRNKVLKLLDRRKRQLKRRKSESGNYAWTKSNIEKHEQKLEKFICRDFEPFYTPDYFKKAKQSMNRTERRKQASIARKRRK